MSDVPLLTALTPDHKRDLAASAKKLTGAVVNKYHDSFGQRWIGFTQPDFVRIMKLVAGVHLLLQDNEALEKQVQEVQAAYDSMEERAELLESAGRPRHRCPAPSHGDPGGY